MERRVLICRWGALLMAFICLALVGCGGGTAPLSRPRMLVYDTATGAVADRLRQEFVADCYTGSQDLSRYQFVVFDASALGSPDAPRLDLARRALAKGVSVLFLNAQEPTKAALTASHLTQAYVSGPSAAYLITPYAGGRIMHLTTLRGGTVHEKINDRVYDKRGFVQGSVTTTDTQLALEGNHVEAFAAELHKRLESQGRAPVNAPNPPSDYPSDSWFQTNVTETWSISNDQGIAGQSLAHNVTYSFYVYYDNGSTFASHNFQWCAVAVDGIVTNSPPAHYASDNKGFAHTMTQVELNPVNTNSGNGLQLALVYAQPTNTSSILTSSSEFSIGYKGSQGNTAWLWQQTLVQTGGVFFDWTAIAPPSPTGVINAVQLQYMQNSPFSGDGSNVSDGLDRGVFTYSIKDLSLASIIPMGIVGQALWKTEEVTNDVVQVSCQSLSNMINLSVSNYFFYRPEHYSHVLLSYDPVVVNLDFGQVSPP